MAFSPDLGLYIWDINSPIYTRITKSPAVLNFTFRLSQSIASNVTISVPFPLLTLTLKYPLAQSAANTKYFPCTTLVEGTTILNDAPAAILGRAFLQAAFIGINWSDKSGATWFMAQAPGPNTPGTASVKDIPLDNTTIIPSQNSWINTWDGGWAVLAKDGTTALVSPSQPVATATGSGISRISNSGGHSTSSLTVAVKIGLGIGLGIFVFGVTTAALLWRKKRGRRNQQRGLPIEATHACAKPCETAYKYGGFMPGELEGNNYKYQDRLRNPQELEDHDRRSRPQELESDAALKTIAELS